MQTSPKHAPTAKQKRFHNALRANGCVITGEKVDIQLHHPAGAAGRHNKQKIGQWFVYILRRDFHDNRAGMVYNVTDNKNGFQINYGREADIFMRGVFMLIGAVIWGESNFDLNDLPPAEIMDAIQDLRQ